MVPHGHRPDGDSRGDDEMRWGGAKKTGDPKKMFLVPAKAVIRDIRNEAPGVRTFLLETVAANTGEKMHAENLQAQPRVLQTAKPGQFNMLGYPGAGEAPISFSVLPSGEDKKIFGHTVRIAGRVTSFLCRLGPGDELFFRGPFGRGWPLEAAKGKHLLIISGGLGLAPLRPVIEAARLLGPIDVTLLHGAREPGDIIFKQEFSRWLAGGAVKIGLTADNPGGGTARVDEDLKVNIRSGLITGLIGPLRIDPARTVAFICGPEIMMRFSARELMLKGMAGADIHVSVERRMKCGTGHCGHCQIGPWFACMDGPVFTYGQLKGLPDVIL